MTHTELDYTPQIVLEQEGTVWATVLIQLNRCAVCRTPMLPKPHSPEYGAPPWPTYYRISMTAQRVAAGWHWESGIRDGNARTVCHVCAKADKGTFTCYICDQERPSSQLHQTYGDTDHSTDHTCTVCYDTIPASQWDAAEQKLEEQHRFDFC